MVVWGGGRGGLPLSILNKQYSYQRRILSQQAVGTDHSNEKEKDPNFIISEKLNIVSSPEPKAHKLSL